MIRTFAAVGSVLLMGTSLHAQSVVVRSGEHSDFTRVTFELKDIPVPSAARSGETLTISFASDRASFDLSNAFRRISRSRVERISTTGQTVEIQINCNCLVNTFVENNETLFVVDVLDTKNADPISSDQQQQMASTAMLPLFSAGWQYESILAGRAFDTLIPASVAQAGLTTLILGEKARKPDQPELSEYSPQPAGLRETVISVPEMETNNRQPVATPRFRHSSSAIILQSSLLHGLRTAEESGQEHSDRQNLPRSNGRQNLNIRFRDANSPSVDPVLLDQRECHSEILFEIGDWFSTRDFPNLLADIHRDIAHDLNGDQNFARVDLLKLYLSFGLLAEAEQVSRSFQDRDFETRVYISILLSLKNAGDRTEGTVQFDHTCSERERFWAMLSAENENDHNDLTELEYRQQVQQLPKEIRHLVLRDFRGPDLLVPASLQETHSIQLTFFHLQTANANVLTLLSQAPHT